MARYVETISEAARRAVPAELISTEIDIEIWFAARGLKRADVDNVIKPVLDALAGTVYRDDRQVRSVRAVALQLDLPCTLTGGDPDTIHRLLNNHDREFLVDVYEGVILRGYAP